jgi:hypothetical protein
MLGYKLIKILDVWEAGDNFRKNAPKPSVF